jgi:hypothetical protein
MAGQVPPTTRVPEGQLKTKPKSLQSLSDDILFNDESLYFFVHGR